MPPLGTIHTNPNNPRVSKVRPSPLPQTPIGKIYTYPNNTRVTKVAVPSSYRTQHH